MKNLTYKKQREIEEPIEELLARIGVKCRGRLEVNDGEKVSVIEFEGDEKGKWEKTNWHGIGGDESSSIFWAFRIAVPFCKHFRRLMEDLERTEQLWGQKQRQ